MRHIPAIEAAALPRHAPAIAVPAGRIGPNAITQMAEALTAHGGPELTTSIFVQAGLGRYLDAPPTAMVDEAQVARLHRAVALQLPRRDGIAVARDAGRRTARYLLSRRIPKPAQWLLRRLPRKIAAGTMVRAIAGHAWTFAGSGQFTHAFDPVQGRTLWLAIAGSPLGRDPTVPAPACEYFAATFEGVFAAILGPAVRVAEVECSAAGADACRFRVCW